MVDLEEEFHAEELTKLTEDVKTEGLGLLVFADWYNSEAMGRMGFYDDNTRSWWTPATGGCSMGTPCGCRMCGIWGVGVFCVHVYSHMHPYTQKTAHIHPTHITPPAHITLHITHPPRSHSMQEAPTYQRSTMP